LTIFLKDYLALKI